MKSYSFEHKLIVLLTIVSVILILLPPITAKNHQIDLPILTNTKYEYFTYPKMTSLLHNLSQNYSNIMSLTSIGKTYEKRDIWMVKLSDNVDQQEDESGVLLMGAHHGNEKPSFEVLIYFINYMLEGYNKENTDDDLDGFLNEDIIDGFDNDNDGLIDEDPSEDRVRNVLETTQIYLIPKVRGLKASYSLSPTEYFVYLVVIIRNREKIFPVCHVWSPMPAIPKEYLISSIYIIVTLVKFRQHNYNGACLKSLFDTSFVMLSISETSQKQINKDPSLRSG